MNSKHRREAHAKRLVQAAFLKQGAAIAPEREEALQWLTDQSQQFGMDEPVPVEFKDLENWT